MMLERIGQLEKQLRIVKDELTNLKREVLESDDDVQVRRLKDKYLGQEVYIGATIIGRISNSGSATMRKCDISARARVRGIHMGFGVMWASIKLDASPISILIEAKNIIGLCDDKTTTAS